MRPKSRRSVVRTAWRPHVGYENSGHVLAMGDVAEPVSRLIDQFKKLPGIGAKSAQRLAFFVLKMDSVDAGQIAEAILEVKRSIRCCSVCNNLTDIDPCHFCANPSRSDKSLCVVEESTNILAVEK